MKQPFPGHFVQASFTLDMETLQKETQNLGTKKLPVGEHLS